ncbi:hypothetical protein BUPH_08224 (plasmid) [Paraburkholderia phenoliruptrix BR3459a]|uniref:Uncharacterized protein n=1 Tax=Paraburkholderia phenoliruptrix BR3459a TaxID=1229205 RepID=K0E2K0_9BURK|nr:hypothetical protein BUPH_08224 [Paraburkholderia phenoliruptrix BR3459a]
MRVRVVQVADDCVLHVFPEMRGPPLQTRHAVEHIDHQIEAVDLIQYRQFERRVDVALLLVAAYVQMLVIAEPIGELCESATGSRGS